jgi:Fur family ferric uptake transcriptional regulator
MKNTDYEADLRRGGLKSTRQRTAILEILDQSEQPLAAEQVFMQLKQRGICVNLSTVYRVLETLAEKKLAVKLSITGDTRALFEYNRMLHRHYLVCLGCKKILAIHHCPLAGYEQTLQNQTNYKISGHRLDIYGYCPACQKKYFPDG